MRSQQREDRLINLGISGQYDDLMTCMGKVVGIKFCKERSVADGSSFLIPGVVAPLVLDSPFGQLDNTYRSDTARFIPDMAQQVALFVSSSQGSADVLEVLKDRIGKQYVLVSENSGPRDGRHEERIVLGGKVYETLSSLVSARARPFFS